jgi:hypothetical protein
MLFLANTLHNLGGLLTEAGSAGEARPVMEESVTFYVRLREDEPDWVSIPLARGLLSLALAAHFTGEPAEALPPLRESIRIWREQLERRGGQARVGLAQALTLEGQVLGATGQTAEAERSFHEALRLSADLNWVAMAEAHASAQMAYGQFLEKQGRSTAAIDKYRAAVMASEGGAGGEPPQGAKGKVAYAYARSLDAAAERGDADEAYRWLVALRDGSAAALGSNAQERQAATDALAAVEADAGCAVRIVVAERTPAGSVFVTVGSDRVLLEISPREALGRAATRLWSVVVSAADGSRHRKVQERVNELGVEVWRLLPGGVRDALGGGGEVLISGDGYWSDFPGKRCSTKARACLSG